MIIVKKGKLRGYNSCLLQFAVFGSSKIQCPQNETPFQESFSLLQDIILFVPCTSRWESSAFSFARDDMHDGPEIGNTLVGPSKWHALSKFRVISNSCDLFSHFGNRIKWDGNDRANVKGTQIHVPRRAYRAVSFAMQTQYSPRCSYRQKG